MNLIFYDEFSLRTLIMKHMYKTQASNRAQQSSSMANRNHAESCAGGSLVCLNLVHVLYGQGSETKFIKNDEFKFI